MAQDDDEHDEDLEKAVEVVSKIAMELRSRIEHNDHRTRPSGDFAGATE